ncbi:Paired amphipathic helix [Arabidopsis suecica]|uniref:Paired amphipathic helix n=1 Tax=Arabidopsis suecica TaxID=45249 RepID=A0A8T2CF95_ARASU|nr:Paired amphipathic helix [Arabidopsis suecica]
MAGEGSKSKATIDDAYAYLRTVKSTFRNDGDKYEDFIAIMNNFKARKIDRNACIEEVKDLLKGHRDLISGFNAFLPKCLEIADWYNLEGR